VRECCADLFLSPPLSILRHLSLSLVLYRSFFVLFVSPVPFCPGRRNTGRGACALAAAARYASVEFAILSRHVIEYISCFKFSVRVSLQTLGQDRYAIRGKRQNKKKRKEKKRVTSHYTRVFKKIIREQHIFIFDIKVKAA